MMTVVECYIVFGISHKIINQTIYLHEQVAYVQANFPRVQPVEKSMHISQEPGQ